MAGLLEIKGCMFFHTLKRELHMTCRIEEILSRQGLLVGNQSVGFWQYLPTEDEFHDEFPEIGKFCGIFKTLGDRRVATHLLQGLHVLIRFLVQQFPSSLDARWILDSAPARRRNAESGRLSNTPFDFEASG